MVITVPTGTAGRDTVDELDAVFAAAFVRDLAACTRLSDYLLLYLPGAYRFIGFLRGFRLLLNESEYISSPDAKSDKPCFYLCSSFSFLVRQEETLPLSSSWKWGALPFSSVRPLASSPPPFPSSEV